MAIQQSSKILSLYSSVPKASVGRFKKSIYASPEPSVRLKVKIPEELKAGGTLIKKMEVVITSEGPKVNLVR